MEIWMTCDWTVDLMMGDCLEMMGEIEPGSVDLVLTDPPYGTTACKWDSVIPLEPMWAQVFEACAQAYWRSRCSRRQQPFIRQDTRRITTCLGYVKYEWIWRKSAGTGHLNVEEACRCVSIEDVLVFYAGQFADIQSRKVTRRSKTLQ
jgi:hypothetical protein